MQDLLNIPLMRRTLFSRVGLGLGSIAFAGMAGSNRPCNASTGKIYDQIGTPLQQGLHHLPKAKRVIFLYMSGGPSHLETYDFKEELEKRDGEPMPDSVTKGQPIAQLQGKSRLRILGPRYRFQRFGESGQLISEAIPHIGSIADDICIIRSMVTEAINHDPAHTFMNTGSAISGRPSMGAWINYGLGSVCDNLPGFVVMTSFGGRSPQPISSRMWHNGYLPGKYQGILLRSQGNPVEYLQSPLGTTQDQQSDVIQATAALNRLEESTSQDHEIATRIAQYEMAFRMQASIPELMDFRDESAADLALYGCSGKADGSFAANCLMARRMAERGVRFIQLYHRDWDHHNDLKKFVNICAGHTDRASAALVQDLKKRGLLDDTLVIWGGEFGRTPMAQDGKGEQLGRDHHMKGFSMWLAGGGVRGGISHGQTDELGYHSVENIVHVHDLHATILHLLGIDHQRLTVRAQGRDFRLTDVAGNVVSPILK